MTLHNQLLINGYTNNAITSEAEAVEWMQSLVDSINMKTIQGPYASYVTKDGNRGLTCVVMIETSHIALHVWDEPDPAAIQFDLYTCGELPIQDVINNLESSLGLFNYKYLVLEREVGFNQVMSGNGGFVL